mmetsp:Transcript_93552/g.301058  ORF Transcript_93552/g.301058 Transcript_93552/m.301058 type:complete len:161 (+) Transcript_93552:155-637(+)
MRDDVAGRAWTWPSESSSCTRKPRPWRVKVGYFQRRGSSTVSRARDTTAAPGGRGSRHLRARRRPSVRCHSCLATAVSRSRALAPEARIGRQSVHHEARRDLASQAAIMEVVHARSVHGSGLFTSQIKVFMDVQLLLRLQMPGTMPEPNASSRSIGFDPA